jgi:acyl-homoserine lactone acylase PvdQ
VPRIFATSAAGACFGAGYAQAEDRLEELLKQYRRAAGTMAEVFGPEHFRDDYRQRLWRHAEVSRRRHGKLGERTRECLEAFVGGVKRYMEAHPEKVPAWATEPEPWMVVALGRYIIWGWPEGTAAEDLQRAGIRPDPVEPRASNQWVVSGRRTELGVPIALIDPHLSWYGPFRFYEEHLHGGELQVAGVTVLGTPIPSLGHNRYLSVAMTTGGPDTSDVYEITLDPARPGKYLYDGEWRDLEVWRDVIRVKEAAGVKEVPIEILATHHGPIVAHRDGKGYAMKIPYADEVQLSEQTYELMTSRDLGEAKRALGRLQLMEQNVMVATVDGDIFYVRNGRVPIRPDGFEWHLPVPGNTSKSEWLGIHDFDDLLQIENPEQGYMQNCNVSPAVMMVGSPLTEESFAARPYLFNADQPYLHQRAAQTRAELHAETRLTVERAIEIAHSTAVFQAGVWQARLKDAAAAATGGAPVGDDRVLLQLILGWDGRADAGSAGATAYHFWKEGVYAADAEAPAAAVLRGEKRLGPLARLYDRAGLPPLDVPQEVLLGALAPAAARLRAGWRRLEVPFGEIFRIRREGSARDFPLGGGNLEGMSTPRAVSYRDAPDGAPRFGRGGQTATQVVVLTRPPQSYSLLPLGESDEPGSPHFDDQAEKLMSPARLKPTYFLEREGPHVRSKLDLQWTR